MADPWGIEPGWWDVRGQWHDAPEDTRRALRVAMGGLPDVDDPPPGNRPVWFVRHGSGPPIQRPALLVLEDGTHVDATYTLPPDLPLGYHDLHPDDGGPTTRLIVVPERAAPAPEAGAGIAVQLYAARSADSWGIGDLADLATLGRWTRAAGAPIVLCSPLHAPLPLPTVQPSPYFASSRRWRNPLHLRLEAVPGWDGADPQLAALAARGRALLAGELIDRDAIWAAKSAALELLWERGRASYLAEHRFRTYRAAEGEELVRYATFCALAEHHGTGWPSWPSDVRRPDGPGVARFAGERGDRLDFHAWLQWLLDEQVGEAAGQADLLHDLAVGADIDGADGWLWQDVLAPGVRVGAPPDEFNPAGQDWGLPPFTPWRLRAEGYQPLASLFRGAMRHGAGLRVDHVMGLFRLFWIPAGAGPGAGGYVRYPGTELLDVLALESARAGTYVVGEDLGTVEDEVREALAARGVLSYRLAWFEDEPPEAWPHDALAAVTTHDLPTLAAAWEGSDDPGGVFSGRVRALTGAAPETPLAEVRLALHRRLADARCRLVVATLDDLAGAVPRPNRPGTVEPRNWSIPLPCAVEDLVADGAAAEVLAVLAAHGASPAGD